MYEDRTQLNILKEMIEHFKNDISKMEGSLAYTNAADTALLAETIYIEMERNRKNSFATTCDREHLIERAKERGLKPEEATSAIYRANFNCKLNLKDRFATEEFSFFVSEKITDYEYSLTCEQKGKQANYCIGKNLETLTYNKEFETGIIKELLVPGEDEEETEIFRERYFRSVSAETFSGNIADYENRIHKLSGVGWCKIIPPETERGNILCIFINSEWQQPSEKLVEDIQNQVDPSTDINNWGKEYALPPRENYKGKGYGLAPIDHDVLVKGVENVTINVKLKLELEAGYQYDMLENSIKKVIDEYLLKLSESWKNTTNLIVRKSYIEAAILNLTGVLDVLESTINDFDTIKLDIDQIPVKGDVILIE